MEEVSGGMIAALVGLFGGVGLGAAARLGRFCTLGAIEDALYGGSFERLRMWGLALGLSILGCAALVGSGVLVRDELFLIRDGFSPIGAAFGGALFGYGMALAGNCGYGALARLGTGDLRAFVLVTVMGITAYAALFGPLAELRLWLFNLPVARVEATTTLDQLAASVLPIPGPLIGAVVGGLLCLFMLRGSENRRHTVFWGSIVAVAIITGWGGTALIAEHSFDVIGVRSHNFSAPVGETLSFFMMSSVRPISFAVGSVVGVVLGSVLGSLWRREFRWEACEDPRELKRQLLGAVFMGFGATLALGCSVGQGLSGFAVLSLSAPLVTLSIFAGAALGLRVLIHGWVPNRSHGV